MIAEYTLKGDCGLDHSGVVGVVQNEQAGNRSKEALGEVQTPKGDISEVMSFSGLLPEIINSRAAM